MIAKSVRFIGITNSHIFAAAQFQKEDIQSMTLPENCPDWIENLYNREPDDFCLLRNGAGWFLMNSHLDPILENDWIIQDKNGTSDVYRGSLFFRDFEVVTTEPDSKIPDEEQKPGAIESLILRQTVALEEIAKSLKILEKKHWDNIPKLESKNLCAEVPKRHKRCDSFFVSSYTDEEFRCRLEIGHDGLHSTGIEGPLGKAWKEDHPNQFRAAPVCSSCLQPFHESDLGVQECWECNPED